MRAFLILIGFLAFGLSVSGAPLWAGAWPQARGSGFASADTRLSRPRTDLTGGEVSNYTTFYLEYGLTDRMTLGVDMGRAVSGARKSVIFLRYPLPAPSEAIKLSAEIGLGEINGAPVLRPGLSFGRGFDFGGERYGWLAIDALAEIDSQTQLADYKVDATFGVTFPSQRKVMLQLQSGVPHARDAFVRIAPSVVLPLGQSRHLELGITYGVKGDDQLGVKLGVWQYF